ncbi:MAG: response regulator [Syntrophomonadaceae bacterium]|nr:response regulator [Syntrophomonadaceae bacterium]
MNNEVYISTLEKAQKVVILLIEENKRLEEANKELAEANERLDSSVLRAKEKLIKCPVTGLYNEEFFRKYIQTEASIIGFSEELYNSALLVISVDNMSKIKYNFGNAEFEDFFRNIAYLLNQVKDDVSHMVFRLEGNLFAYYIPNAERPEAVAIAEKIRRAVEESEALIEKMTVSVGVSFLEEIRESNMDSAAAAAFFYDIAVMRVKIAKNRGMNLVCSESEIDRLQEEAGKLLIVDTDQINTKILKAFLENENFIVLTATDGEMAIQLIEKESIDLVVAEIMIPKIDGFLLKERLSMYSHTKTIPFILISAFKDEASVKRAANMDIDGYLKKPYMMVELIGMIKNMVKREASQ